MGAGGFRVIHRHDNHLKHESELCQDYLREKDLNPIQLVWDKVKPTSRPHLRAGQNFVKSAGRPLEKQGHVCVQLLYLPK